MKETIKATNTTEFVFDKINFRWMLIGLALIVVGFLLMTGGGSDDPKVFSEAIFDFRRLTLAPIIVMAGFVVEIYAIMRKPNCKEVAE
ncbi:MAG: DUF3098 domain-containing protein [Bacteroidota bacterium]